MDVWKNWVFAAMAYFEILISICTEKKNRRREGEYMNETLSPIPRECYFPKRDANSSMALKRNSVVRIAFM